MNRICLPIALLGIATFASPTTAGATSITVSLGNTSPSFANGSKPSTVTVQAAQSGSPAPFTGPCGADGSSNCTASWIFNYAIPSGETVTAASLTLGIWDIDSAAAGDQVASYQIVGGDNLTSTFNTTANTLASVNSEYDVFTFALSNFLALDGGSATVQLALKGPGLGVLGTSTFNGALLVFSELDLTTAPGGNPSNPAVPEPATLVLVATGCAAAVARRRKTKG